MSHKNEIDRIRSNCDHITKYCNNNKNSPNDLIGKCVELLEWSERVNEMAITARKSGAVFKSIPVNGYVMCLRIIVKYTNQIVTQIKAENQPDPTFIKLLTAMFAYRDWLYETHRTLIEESVDGVQSVMTKKRSFCSKACYNTVFMDDEVARLLFSTHTTFWLDEGVRKFIRFFIFQMAFATQPPCSFSTLWSTRDVGKYYLIMVRNCNPDFPFSIWRRGGGWFVSKLLNNFVNRKIPVVSHTLHIPKQKRFIFDHRGKILDFKKMTAQEIHAYETDECEQARQRAPGRGRRNKETIRCRFSHIINVEKVKASLKRIKNQPEYKSLKSHTARKNPVLKIEELNNNVHVNGQINELLGDNFEPNPNKLLLLNFPGGGFVAGGSELAEFMYLRELCNNLGGIPILSVDYSLCVPYPIPHQEILDVYLWALSGDEEVKKSLGFYPKQIVITGDSAGGFLTISLTIMINELNKLIENPALKIPLPKSIVTAYPIFSIANLSIMKTYSVLEPILETHLLLIIFSLYGANVWSTGDFKKIENTELYKQIAEQNRLTITRDGIEREFDASMSVKNSTPWFQCDYKTYKNRVDYVNSFYNNPFIAPRLYEDKFDELKSVALYVSAGDLDGTLDDCTELAMKWKGKTCFDSFDNIMHGFLSFSSMGETYNEAFKFMVRRYQEACGLL